MKVNVFVNSINKTNGKVIVTASNGTENGPPLVVFVLPTERVEKCYVGKGYSLTIEEN